MNTVNQERTNVSDNETLELLMKRKSMRVFEDRPVPDEVKQTLLKASLRAATAGNMTLYTIIDVTDPELKKTLSVTCDNQPFIADAPLVLIYCADYRRWYQAFCQVEETVRKPSYGDFMLAAEDAIIAAQTAVTAADALGLGTCYIGDILENCEDVRSALALPPYAVPAAMLVLGRPTQQQRERRKPARFDARDIVRENRYRRMTPEEHEAMYRAREAAEGRADVDYAARMQAFCARKYNSVFSREMSRSAAVYLRAFSAQCTPGTEEGNARGVRRTENSHAGTD